MKLFASCAAIAAVFCLTASCAHKELCYLHPHTAHVRVNVDWSEFESYEKPTGMTMKFYPDRASAHGGRVFTHLTNNVSYANLSLPVDDYHILVFNQSTDEFGSFAFRDMEDRESAVVVMQYRSRWYRSRAGEDNVAAEPEWLGVGNRGGAYVTRNMLNAEIEASTSGKPLPEPPVIAEITPHNVIYTVNVRVYFDNIYNLRSVRASMTGLSEGYLLTREKRLSTSVTHLIEQWSMTRDEDDPSKGYVDATFTCFGLPDGHRGAAEENLLTIEALLVDNKTVETFVFKAGDRFVTDADDPSRMTFSVVISDSSTLSDVKPVDGSEGCFDVTVGDWGEEINQDIQM